MYIYIMSMYHGMLPAKASQGKNIVWDTLDVVIAWLAEHPLPAQHIQFATLHRDLAAR